MKLYLSGRSFERNEVRQLMTSFENIGFTFTFDWTKYNDYMQLLNYEGIDEAEIFIGYMPDISCGYKEVLSELEYAQKKGKITFIYCPYYDLKSAKFYSHPALAKFQVYFFLRKDELIKYVSDMSMCKLTEKQKNELKYYDNVEPRACSR